MIDIDALERLAKAATPGEWKVPSDDLHCVESDECHVAECATWSPDDAKDMPAFDREKCWAYAAFIAAANPVAILSLVAYYRLLRVAFDELLATVRGECPSLIDESRGGSGTLVSLISAIENGDVK